MKKVGIFGGSFNPPTISHKDIADGCIANSTNSKGK